MFFFSVVARCCTSVLYLKVNSNRYCLSVCRKIIAQINKKQKTNKQTNKQKHKQKTKNNKKKKKVEIDTLDEIKFAMTINTHINFEFQNQSNYILLKE